MRPSYRIAAVSAFVFGATGLIAPNGRLPIAARPAQQAANAPVLVRGFIGTAPQGQDNRGEAGAALGDIALPGIEVYLEDTVNGELSVPDRTDLSGRFGLFMRAPNGRYRVCWKDPRYVDGCDGRALSPAGGPAYVGTLRISPKTSPGTTVLFGRVKLRRDGHTRTLEPMLGINAFATVSVEDRGGTVLDKAWVNNFDQYVLPQVPNDRPTALRAEIETVSLRLSMGSGAELATAASRRVDIELPNAAPRIEPLVALDAAGRRVQVAKAGDKLVVGARASDPEGDALRVHWYVAPDQGTLADADTSTATWTLPNRPGQFSIRALVGDGKGGYADSSLLLQANEAGVTFAGVVTDMGGAALQGARVTVNGRLAVTDGSGRFRTRLLAQRRYVLNIRKPGYGLFSQIYDDAVTAGRWSLVGATVSSVDPTQPIDVLDRRGQRNCPGKLSDRLDYRLYPRLARPQYQDGKGNVVAPFAKDSALDVLLTARPGDRTQSGHVRLSAQQALRFRAFLPIAFRAAATPPPPQDCGPGLRVRIPANALVDTNGQPPSGPVDVQVSTIDLLSPEQMPGDFTVALPGNDTRVMQSYGAGGVEITDGSRSFNLKSGLTAEIEIPIDRSQLAAGGTLPPTIPILYYNDQTGVWAREGTATLSGARYVATVSHFSTINMDLVKTDQACVRVLSPTLPTTYKLEITIPMGGGAAPKVLTKTIDNGSPSEHVLYNLPKDTNITLVPIREDNNLPIGTFVVNTGGAQNPTNPNLPAGPPYAACSTQVVLKDLLPPDTPASGEFLHGINFFAASNFAELDVFDPTTAAQLRDATQDYYDQIDPRGKRLTLAAFKATNGFGGAGEITAAYVNAGDLGFGREMHCTTQAASDGNDDYACYVSNYGKRTTDDDEDIDHAVDALVAPDPINNPPIATVAMEYSRIESPTGTMDEFDDAERVVKFYVYTSDGSQLKKEADLDEFGDRPIPQLCMVCHGGRYPAGDVPLGAPVFANRADVKLQSKFLPFDLQLYTFAAAPFDKASQQDEFKKLNEDIVAHAPPDATIGEVITAMYAGVTDQKEDFVVAGWNASPLSQGLYRDVIGPACRTCHVANAAPDLRFTKTAGTGGFDGQLGSVESRVCGEYIMPHAKATYDIFWTSVGPHKPAQLQAYGDSLPAGTGGWSGTVCGDYTPGGSTPVGVYQGQIQPIWDAHCTGCHNVVSQPAGLDLSPANSHAELVGINATQLATMKRVTANDVANSYLVHKLEKSDADLTLLGGSPKQMPRNQPPLSAADITKVKDWINAGAAP